MLQNTFQVTLMLLAIIAIGYFMAKKPWFSEGRTILHVLLTKLLLPVNIFHAVDTNFTYSFPLREIALKLFYSLSLLFCVLLMALLIARLLKIDNFRKGVFVGLVTFPNVVLMGFPIVENALGPEAVSYGVIYFTAFQLFFWTVAPVILLRSNGEQATDIFSLAGMRRIVSPSLIGLLIGIFCALTRMTIPVVLDNIISQIAQATLAISMLFIGTTLAEIELDKLRKFSGDLMLTVFVKAFLAPLVSLLVIRFLPLSEMAKITYFLLTMMPVAINFSVLTYQYECDYSFCSLATPLLNLTGVVAIPIYVLLLDWFPNLI